VTTNWKTVQKLHDLPNHMEMRRAQDRSSGFFERAPTKSIGIRVMTANTGGEHKRAILFGIDRKEKERRGTRYFSIPSDREQEY